MRDGSPETAILVMLCVLVIAIPLGLVIGAVILRSACHFVGVKVPNFGYAMVVALVRGLANFVVSFMVGFGIGMVMGAGSAMMKGDKRGNAEAMMMGAQLLSSIVSLLVNMPISAVIYMGMLEAVSFGKGILIYLVELLISIFIGVGIAALIIGMSFVLMR